MFNLDFYRSILSFLLVLGVLIFVHELGHYLAARWRGVYVEQFSIGFGRRIFSRVDKRGTVWSINWLPLGGFVRLHGQAKPIENKPSLIPLKEGQTFYNKSVLDRAIIVIAGPVANFILAIVIFAGVFTINGKPYIEPVITSVLADSPAENSGLLLGDKFLLVGGEKVFTFEDVHKIITENPSQSLKIVIERNGADKEISTTPLLSKDKIGFLGVGASKVGYEKLGLIPALAEGSDYTYKNSVLILKTIGELLQGKRDTAELGGPIRIAQMSGEAASNGVGGLIIFIALLSINLGLMNLLPIPLLDGGHLMFYLFEAIKGSPLNDRVIIFSYKLGLVAVLTLMCFTTLNDLNGAGLFSWLSSLVK